MVIKIKIISINQKKIEVVVGQGHINFDKIAKNESQRVPIYDKNKGNKESAISSVDFLLTGHSLTKKVSNEKAAISNGTIEEEDVDQ